VRAFRKAKGRDATAEELVEAHHAATRTETDGYFATVDEALEEYRAAATASPSAEDIDMNEGDVEEEEEEDDDVFDMPSVPMPTLDAAARRAAGLPDISDTHGHRSEAAASFPHPGAPASARTGGAPTAGDNAGAPNLDSSFGQSVVDSAVNEGDLPHAGSSFGQGQVGGLGGPAGNPESQAETIPSSLPAPPQGYGDEAEDDQPQ